MNERRLFEVEITQTVYVLLASTHAEASQVAELAHVDRHCFEYRASEVRYLPDDEWLGARPYRKEGYADPELLSPGDLTVRQLIDAGLAPHFREETDDHV